MHHVKTPLLILTCMMLAVLAMIIYREAPRITPSIAPVISNFDECVQAGYAIMESYPRQCRTADGRLFVENVEAQTPPQSDLGLQANGCAVAGCSGELCVSAAEAGDIMTTCQYRAEYACYQEASCEPQADGACGWTETPELNRCLANPPSLEVDAQQTLLIDVQ